ncbi:helicase [Aureococcus anophagefferens]|uniref:Helicase n=1 Tax=Aureococcus anophagefferens TaxID=44056 RepID=A0ABR1G6H6_AURAN
MDAAATNELEDEGDVEGYPREGLCLAVLGDGRAHPAWLCRTRAPAANGRRRVLLYGDGRGASRALNPSERVDPLPGDAALCARLQQDWKDASPGDRDGLLRALDELEARRCAPPSFGAMVKSVRATMAKGPMSAFAPSACLGREFYPNLFPPRVGDAVRVLWDGDVWYEATATGKGDADARADGPARTAAAEKGPAVACGAFYGFDSGDDRELRVRYVEDGTRDSLAWPDPEGEAWLLARPARRAAGLWSPADVGPRARGPRALRALAAARKRVARVGDALRNVAVPLAGLLDDFDDGATARPRRKRDDGDEPPKDDAPPGDWPWAWDEAANARPVKALFALARARPPRTPSPDLEARAKGARAARRSGATPSRPRSRTTPSRASRARRRTPTRPPRPRSATTGGRLQRAVGDVAASGWDKASADETFGPGAADADAARGSPCFALLPDTRVPEPHRSWLRRARARPSTSTRAARAANAASNASSPASDPSTKKKKKLTAKQKREEEERERKRAKQEERDALALARAAALPAARRGRARGALRRPRRAPHGDGRTPGLRANCHFAEITADDARPGLNVAASVVGVFVVATRNIAAGRAAAPRALRAAKGGRDRVEGYWRGSAPPWPATVGAVGADGRLSLAYDDGGVEDDVPPGLCRAATRPPAWRATRRLAVGTWVRRIDPPKDDAPPEGPKKKKLKKPPKQEGVVAALRDDGAFDVLDDDGTLVEQCTARDWEPLLVLRYEEGHDQRVVSMAQLRHLKPQFLDARTLRRPRLDDGDGDLCPEPPVDLRRVLKDSGIKEPRENRRHREDAAASPL